MSDPVLVMPTIERCDDDVRIRAMRPDDIDAGLRLCRAARWNQVASDWHRFLALNPAGAWAAADAAGDAIGTVTSLHYPGGFHGPGGFHWLAMVLVDPAHQRRGLATRLLDTALAGMGEAAVIRLDATPAGEGVYHRRAFQPEETLARMERPALPLEPGADDAGRDTTIGPIEGDEAWPALLALDRAAFGADRAALLRMLCDEAPAVTRVARMGGRVEGALFGRHGFGFEHIGPLIARDARTARALMTSLLREQPQAAFILDTPRRDTAWCVWLTDVGFREQRPFVRLVRGEPGRPLDGRIYATAGADLG